MPEIPAITSYDDARRATQPPPPLPVPPPKRAPKWSVALIAIGVAAFLGVVCAVPSWVVYRGISAAARSSAEETVTPGQDGAAPDYLADDEPVPNAKPDAAFLAVLRSEYPEWRFVSGELSERKWSGGGMRMWAATLESIKHSQVRLDVEYSQMLDAAHTPADEWTTGDDFFKKGGSPPQASALLDRFAADERARPLLIYGGGWDSTTIGGASDTYSISWEDPKGEDAHNTYRRAASGGWTLVSSSKDR